MALAYLKLDPKTLSFYKNHTDAVPLESYKSNRMFFQCDDKKHIANAVDYMKCADKRVRFHKKARMLQTVLTYTVQTPKNDPKLCIVIEFQEPHIRSISADLICVMSEFDLLSLQESITYANYMAVERSNDISEVPLAFEDQEIFHVKTFEEKTLLNFVMVLNQEGILEWKPIKKNQKLIFHLKDIMPDKAADSCGMWFNNIVIPKAMNVEDSNCCFSWRKAPDTVVILCSTDKYRCVLRTRMVINKYHSLC